MPCRNIGPCHALPAWMREPNHADIDGLFCRRGNRDRGGQRWSWRRLSGCEHYQPAYAGSLQAGTQDVGGTDNRLDGTSGAGAACRLRRNPLPRPPRSRRSHRRKRNNSPSRKHRRQRSPPMLLLPQRSHANNVAAAQPVQSRRNLRKTRRTGRRKDRRASGSLRQGARCRRQTRGRRKAARRAAPALGRQAPLPAAARAGARGGRRESPGSDRAAADQDPGRRRADVRRRAGENRNAPDQAVRSGLIDSFRRSRCSWSVMTFL